MAGNARQPRGIVLVNDARVNGWINFSVDNNIFYEADTFRVTFALSALPAAYGDAFWASQQEVFIEVLAGFPQDAENYSRKELQTLTYGRVDEVAFDPVARTLTVTGRDLTAVLIDAKTTETFQNLKASQIATQIAARHGLTPIVTATTTTIGSYYQTDKTQGIQQRSEWDLLTALAGQEQMLVYVKRKELHFEYPPAATVPPYLLTWEKPGDQNGAFAFNGKTIQFTRALTLARGVVVTVQSKNQRGQAIKVTYPAKKAATIKPGASAPVAQQYTYTFAHLTTEAALQKAQQLHDEISKHEVKLNATLPADNILSVASLIQVAGTGTAFDQSYYPESITREMDITMGYTMTVRAKNHSPQSVVPL